MARPHARQVDARLGAEHAHRELLLRHLEREDRDAGVGAAARRSRLMFRQKAVLCTQTSFATKLWRTGNREVVDLLHADGLDGDDLVPVDVARREIVQATAPERDGELAPGGPRNQITVRLVPFRRERALHLLERDLLAEDPDRLDRRWRSTGRR
jgi:hypothetical protein